VLTVPAKQIEIKPWDIRSRALHSPIGQRLWRRRCFSLALTLLTQTRDLSAITDAELRRRAQALLIAPPSPTSTDPALVCAPFPLIIETIRRAKGFTLHPNQVAAAITMRMGAMVELATGEGKTMVALLTSAAFALGRQPVHVMTANRYLATRDAQGAAEILDRIGLTAAAYEQNVPDDRKQWLYRRNLLYATLADFGFDWLRDRLAAVRQKKTPVMSPLKAAVVDEADQIMIDEGRTPLILAEEGKPDPVIAGRHEWAGKLAASLVADQDYHMATGGRIDFDPQFIARHVRVRDGAETALRREALTAALRARLFFRRDIDYIIDTKENDVVIVDEKTGRVMPGRRWQDGLYEAVLLKEGLKLRGPTRTTAQVTVQQFLVQYAALCGCSGTMGDAAPEVKRVYNRKTLAIPPHRPCLRKMLPDVVYATRREQFRAVAHQARQLIAAGRSVLIGTTHITTSLALSQVMTEQGIAHTVLNALEEEREAQIVELAGQPGAVTVATNMAGRGTDIKLHEDVKAAGGLHVIGLQRHDSGRVDRQLVGRCARQGDPGSAQFILCLQDPLLRKHAHREASRLRLRRRRRDQPVTASAAPRLFRRVQRQVEGEHRRSRISLIQHNQSITAMLGVPDYMT
jgi:preprotein translocase subunit SecA